MTGEAQRNGGADLRRTHPNLYRLVSAIAVMHVALGCNFLVFTPTFLIYGQSNRLWASLFLASGLSLLFFLNVHRSLQAVRITLLLGAVYVLSIALGTMQPALEGQGSLQLPIMYFGMCLSMSVASGVGADVVED